MHVATAPSIGDVTAAYVSLRRLSMLTVKLQELTLTVSYGNLVLHLQSCLDLNIKCN